MPLLQAPLDQIPQTQIPDSGENPADTTSLLLQEIKEGIAKVKDSNFSFSELFGSWLSRIIDFGLRVLLALVIFYLLRRIIKAFSGWVKRKMQARNMDAGLTGFLTAILQSVAYIILVLVLVDILGFQSVSFAALMAAIGVAIGAALSGQLQNFAAGVVLLTTRPIRVGDWIEAQGDEGEVTNISIFYTTLLRIDRSTTHVPNALLTSGKITNYSSEKLRLCQWVVPLEYGVDLDLAKQTLMKVISAEPRFKEPVPVLLTVKELGTNGVNLIVRVYCENNLYWDLIWEINEQIYRAFREEKIPFALNAVRVYQGGTATSSEGKG